MTGPTFRLPDRSIVLSTLVAAAIVVGACGNVGDAPQAQTGDVVAIAEGQGIALPIDPQRSSVNWRAAKVTRAHEGGFEAFEGVVSVDDVGQVVGVNLVIDTKSIWSDTERLTNHLKSEDFFDVENFTTAIFEASEFVPVDSAGATHLITGNLTMHGQSNGITVPATVTTENGLIRAEADFIIDRTRWGINYKGRADDLISDDVRLILDIVASEDVSLASD